MPGFVAVFQRQRQEKPTSLLPLTRSSIVLIGCGQAEQDRREAAKKNVEEIGKSLEAYEAKQQKATTSLPVFENCNLPIFQSSKPSICSECHLSGGDLKEYTRPTQQETFVSLAGAGMIDMENPDDSQILRFIKLITCFASRPAAAA